jgi:hypothetical protein
LPQKHGFVQSIGQLNGSSMQPGSQKKSPHTHVEQSLGQVDAVSPH